MIFYLDTSALLKRYKTERGTDVIDRLYASKEDLLTSQFACVEVAAVATRALKGKVFDGDTYMKFMGSFTHDLRDRLMPWPLSHESVWETFADAVKNYAGPTEPFYFVCSDRELLGASKTDGMDTLDPESFDAMRKLDAWGL